MAFATMVAWHAAAQSPDDTTETLLPPDIERGQAVAVGAEGSAEQACMACHGVDGAGDAAAAFPRLAGQSFVYLATTLIDFAAGERPHEIMTPIAAALTRQQIIDVAAYYASLMDTVFAAPATTDAATLQLGGTIAAVGLAPAGVQGCINCHGADGAGLGYEYPALGGQHEAYLEARLLAFKSGESVGDAQGIMRGIASRLSDEEIAAVSAYYGSLRPEPVEQSDLGELPLQLLDAFNDDDGESAE